MKIKLLSSIGISGRFYSAGEIISVENRIAQDLLNRKKATPFFENLSAQEAREAAKTEPEVETYQDDEEFAPEEQETENQSDYSYSQLKAMANEIGIVYPEQIEPADLQALIERYLAETE